MYNMDITILGYKFNVEILILIGVVYLILVGHMFCGCCNFTMMEGLSMMEGAATAATAAVADSAPKHASDKKANLHTQVAAGTDSDMAATPPPSVPTTPTKEGFTGANINYGESSVFDLSSDTPVNTSSWSAPDMTVVPGQPLNAAVKKFLAREPQPVPLPEGEMLLFANTPFKPECCPNTFSTSTGCACMTGKQYNFLITRAGNNVPYSEY
jgi:hypothetical protein